MLVSLNSAQNVAASKLGYSSYSKSGLPTFVVGSTKLNFLLMSVQQLLSHQLSFDTRYNHERHVSISSYFTKIE